ncbi:MAG: MATE family efflux transporter [Mycoplasmatales bacterium]
MIKVRNIRKMIDVKFYKVILLIAIPVMTQNFITSLAQIVDNLMVSALGEGAIAAVGAANSIFFVVMLLMFGISESIGIYIAQFMGAKEYEKQKHAFIIGLIATFIVIFIAFIVINVFKDPIIGFYIKDPSVAALCKEYLSVASLSYIFMGINVLIGASFRSIGKPKYAMYCGIVAILINTLLNYMFLNGVWFFPEFGLTGLGIATVIARIVELILLLIIMFNIHVPFMPKFGDFFRIKKTLVKSIFKKGLPLTINEFLWGLGTSTLMALYGISATQDLVAVNIAYTVGNLFMVTMGGFAVAISVIVGQRLGAKKLYGAKYIVTKIYILSFLVGIFITVIFWIIAPIFASIYNISPETEYLTIQVMRIMALAFPLYIITASFFFTLRSGGDTLSVLILDMGAMYILTIPLAYYLATFTDLPVVYRFAIIQCVDIIKFIVGIYLISKGHWIRKLT